MIGADFAGFGKTLRRKKEALPSGKISARDDIA